MARCDRARPYGSIPTTDSLLSLLLLLSGLGVWPPSSLAILLDLIQMPGIEPDQTHDGATAFRCPDDPQHLTHLALADVDGHLGHPDGHFRRAVPANPAGQVMVVRNHEVLCNPIPAPDVPGFRFTRNQNGVILARCTTCRIGFVVREENAERVRLAMGAHQD